MATNYIVAVDLGSSRIAGIIGTKDESGVFTVIACETEPSANCIRRGVIYNVEQAAFHIKAILNKLRNKIPGREITKVYVGVGGQSIRSIDHAVAKSLGADGEVTKEIIQELHNECKNFKPDTLDVLSIVSPAYYLDGRYETNPVGVPCSRIEIRYKLIVCRPALKQHIINSITKRAKIEIADIFVSPLALADMVLTDEERSLGCALIDFGAGVTSVSVFKDRRLVNLWVIPLGSHLITMDITSLKVIETEAERLKKTYGDAVPSKDDDDTPIQVNMTNSMGTRQLNPSELNEVVAARLQEILENIYARLEEADLLDSLNAGLIITGGGALLKNMEQAVCERFQMDAHPASIRKSFAEKTNGTIEPEFAVAVGLFMKGTVDCAPALAPTLPPRPKQPIHVMEGTVSTNAGGETDGGKETGQEGEGGNVTAGVETGGSGRGTGRKPPVGKGKKFIDKAANFVGRWFDDEPVPEKKDGKKAGTSNQSEDKEDEEDEENKKTTI